MFFGPFVTPSLYIWLLYWLAFISASLYDWTFDYPFIIVLKYRNVSSFYNFGVKSPIQVAGKNHSFWSYSIPCSSWLLGGILSNLLNAEEIFLKNLTLCLPLIHDHWEWKKGYLGVRGNGGERKADDFSHAGVVETQNQVETPKPAVKMLWWFLHEMHTKLQVLNLDLREAANA